MEKDNIQYKHGRDERRLGVSLSNDLSLPNSPSLSNNLSLSTRAGYPKPSVAKSPETWREVPQCTSVHLVSALREWPHWFLVRSQQQ